MNRKGHRMERVFIDNRPCSYNLDRGLFYHDDEFEVLTVQEITERGLLVLPTQLVTMDEVYWDHDPRQHLLTERRYKAILYGYLDFDTFVASHGVGISYGQEFRDEYAALLAKEACMQSEREHELEDKDMG